ncbi:MAG: hypothetical protein LBF94_03285, partial [Puniceicoccales bacterium]|nr:hypothetical protein [Puniceicoccales bacterium]
MVQWKRGIENASSTKNRWTNRCSSQRESKSARVQYQNNQGKSLAVENAVNARSLEAFTAEVHSVASSSAPLRRGGVWNMLLELFDRIFGSKETKLTYQVRDAIANRADNVLNVLLNGTNAEATRVRDELR